MRLTIPASEIHLRDKIVVKDVEAGKELFIELQAAGKNRDRNSVLVKTQSGITLRYKWNEYIEVERDPDEEIPSAVDIKPMKLWTPPSDWYDR